MPRVLWLASSRVEPEESFYALKGMRPAPEPIPFSEATPELLSRRLVDLILVDGRGQATEAAAVIRKLRGETPANLIAVLDPDDLGEFDWGCGAVDFLMGSASRPELEARLRLHTAREEPDESDVIRRGEISINRERFEVKVAGEPLDLTFKEFELIAYLASRPGKVCSRNTLLSEVWGYDFFGGTRTVDVHVRRLRAKLGSRADAIETVRNVGYRFAG